MILADEGLNGFIVRALREADLSVDWISEISSGIPDIEVIELAKKNKQVLITEDKDFGEWVFAHKITGLTIVFLRYQKKDFDLIVHYLKELLPVLVKESTPQFITINKNKVRKRTI